jgi:hypothetical protein
MKCSTENRINLSNRRGTVINKDITVNYKVFDTLRANSPYYKLYNINLKATIVVWKTGFYKTGQLNKYCH